MTDTKTRILDAAERLFAERGFDATSLRAITGAAGVNLAAVNYHFRSKEALIRAVFARRLEPLNRERIALLDAYEQKASPEPVPLENILRAFIEPVLHLGDDDPEGDSGFKKLMGRMYSEPSVDVQRIFSGEIHEFIARFYSAFHRALPDLPRPELFWRCFFAIGAMAFTLSAGTLLHLISDGTCDPSDPDAAAARMIGFFAGGLRAPVPPWMVQKTQRKKRKGVRSAPAHPM